MALQLKNWLIIILCFQFSNTLVAQTVTVVEITEIDPSEDPSFDIKMDYEIDTHPIGVYSGCDSIYDRGCLLTYVFSEIKKIFHYPLYAHLRGISGQSYVEFVIDNEAKITRVHIAKSSGNDLLDMEAVKMVSNLPKLSSAAMLNGKPVATKYTIPIRFKTTIPINSDPIVLQEGVVPPKHDKTEFEDVCDNSCFSNKCYAKIQRAFNYPVMAKDQNQQGTVFVEMIISLTGEIEDVKVAKSSGFKLLDKEAISMVEALPKFEQPATIDGQAIELKFEISVTFKLVH